MKKPSNITLKKVVDILIDIYFLGTDDVLSMYNKHTKTPINKRFKMMQKKALEIKSVFDNGLNGGF